jgi:hypothetical protein
MVEKTAAYRRRRADDTQRWRERLHRGAAVYPVEVDGELFDLMGRFCGLKDSKIGDRQAVAAAQVAAPRAGGVAAGRSCFPALARACPHKRGHWLNVRSCGEPDTPG